MRSFDEIIHCSAAWGQRITQIHWTNSSGLLPLIHSDTYTHKRTHTHTWFGSCRWVKLWDLILFTVMFRPAQHCRKCCRKLTHIRGSHIHTRYTCYTYVLLSCYKTKAQRDVCMLRLPPVKTGLHLELTCCSAPIMSSMSRNCFFI